MIQGIALSCGTSQKGTSNTRTVVNCLRLHTAGARWQRAAMSRDRGGGDVGSDRGQIVSASSSCPKEGLTKSLLADKKSTPRIGFEIAARMKVLRKVLTLKVKDFLTLPQEQMGLPSAPESGMPEEGVQELCGKTLTAAPVSTRNFFVLILHPGGRLGRQVH
jgi:hypothetical protein